MRRVVQISDPHFGTIRPELVDPMIETVNGLSPDLVILSGDLTQRAKDGEYAQAMTMLSRVEAPVLVVPGNHDTPLYNLWLRFVHPWRRYNRWVGEEMFPTFQDERMLVMGVNTVNRFAWRSGKLTPATLDRMCKRLEAVPDDLLKIVVVHHPLAQQPKDGRRRTRGGKAAVKALCERGVDLVLSGHMHMWRVQRFQEREGQYSALQIQAGTVLSNRLRGERNDFALLSFDSQQAVSVERFVADPVEGSFEPQGAEDYVNRPGTGWQRRG